MDMKEQSTKQEKTCFIITPIGDENSATFRKAKGVIESVIKPVLSEKGFEDIKPSYEINISGMINTQIINRIIGDDLVIANLTGTNPNVMYELCLRHVVAKPIIHICESGTVLPFDIKDSRTIFYENDMLGVEELKKRLTDFLENMDYQSEYRDNPVYTAYRLGNLLKEKGNESRNEELQLLIKISEEISGLKHRSAMPVGRYFGDSFGTEVIEELNEMDTGKIENLLGRSVLEGINGYLLAKELGISIATMRYIADKSGVELPYLTTDIGDKSLRKILKFVLNIRSEAQ